ncbi:PepSY-associated TM helix domain-containing protein [Hyphomonas sp. WL0036]|uniref:PepSY-associated TM helix domain-containing protein n=1 Tax=Hyphomonas sediminis TaxID=2866160 RepID=UPI001C7F5D64|nr:PepSY-associated TM helix domain-containing protein [Hyphomonas sediminis]MBY9067500.1 PepSY-associated TM helix domain-containing protein [Hyphomonas sediminis]
MKQFLAAARSSETWGKSPLRHLEKWSTYAFWKRQARTWHWMSGAVCLIGMLLFALTGITLNHAHQIPAKPKVTELEYVLSGDALAAISPDTEFVSAAALPAATTAEIRRELNVDISGKKGEWTDIDVYVSLPRPGGDAWMSIDRETGDVLYEVTSRGPISYLNDLHKGRNAGAIWSLFLDVFAVACIVFCMTGLWLLQIHSQRRGSTWPLVLGGLAIPVVILLFFLHI